MKENNYDFRKRLLEVHKPGLRDYALKASDNEIFIDDDWIILISASAGRVIFNAAKDLQDFLLVSMGVSVRVKRLTAAESGSSCASKTILLAASDEIKLQGELPNISMSYRLITEMEKVTVYGFDERGVAQGCYYLEDLMKLRRAPVIPMEDVVRKPLFSPRMIHSGYGLDMFPDSHLMAIAHAGMDAILIFTKDVDTTPNGYIDFNELIYRAEGYGLDVYAYSYLKSLKHPEEKDAEEYYEGTYGKLFKKCPGLKGIVMVGESVEFPSKDERASGKFYYENTVDGLPTGKPSPGWWPCSDYPQWLDMIKKVTRRHKPEADIVFWTYNWGYVDKKERLELLYSVPTDISLLVTFEMFQKTKIEDATNICVDYTLSFEGPGEYFSSEAEVAHERGIRLYTMCNTGGLTWDIGVIPYEPAPYQWIRRHDALRSARNKWGLCGLMESHHYGFWPSFISEIAKWGYWTPSPSSDEVCRLIAERDFGCENADAVLEAWKAWSEGIRHYVPTNEDQYGPFRVGPAYPLVFRNGVTLQSVSHAMFGGNKICDVNYGIKDSYRNSLFQHRLPVEIRSLQKMEECYKRGLDIMQEVYSTLSGNRRDEAFYLINMIKFIINCVKTTINVKHWVTLKLSLAMETDTAKINESIDKMIEIGRNEIQNAQDTIPLVEADSRLGWEPSMEYMTDAYHLQWKIRQVKAVIEEQLPAYRSALKYIPD